MRKRGYILLFCVCYDGKYFDFCVEMPIYAPLNGTGVIRSSLTRDVLVMR